MGKNNSNIFSTRTESYTAQVFLIIGFFGMIYPQIPRVYCMSFSGKWMQLEIIRLSEICQIEKKKCHMFSLIYGIQT
jgi:hypothetical protein